MKAIVHVSFEYENLPTQDWKGEIEGFSAHTIVHRAVETAERELKPRCWDSMVVTIVSREGVRR